MREGGTAIVTEPHGTQHRPHPGARSCRRCRELPVTQPPPLRILRARGGRALAVRADISQHGQCESSGGSHAQRLQTGRCVVGAGGGWRMEPVDRLDSAAALDDAQKELAPVYGLMPLVLPGMYKRCGRVIAIALGPPYNSPARLQRRQSSANRRVTANCAWCRPGQGRTDRVADPSCSGTGCWPFGSRTGTAHDEMDGPWTG
jgi:hypothetical protein